MQQLSRTLLFIFGLSKRAPLLLLRERRNSCCGLESVRVAPVCFGFINKVIAAQR